MVLVCIFFVQNRCRLRGGEHGDFVRIGLDYGFVRAFRVGDYNDFLHKAPFDDTYKINAAPVKSNSVTNSLSPVNPSGYGKLHFKKVNGPLFTASHDF